MDKRLVESSCKEGVEYDERILHNVRDAHWRASLVKRKGGCTKIYHEEHTHDYWARGLALGFGMAGVESALVYVRRHVRF